MHAQPWHPPGSSGALLGTFEAPIDAAGQVCLPPPFRAALAGSVLTSGFDGCLHLLTAASWRALAGNAAPLAPAGTPARRLRRLIFASASEVQPDSQGRIAIPANLRECAAIGEHVVFAGLYSYAEVWSYERWQALQAGMHQQTASLAQMFAGLLRTARACPGSTRPAMKAARPWRRRTRRVCAVPFGPHPLRRQE
jgi:MraZ protein